LTEASNPNPGARPPTYLYKFRSLATDEQQGFVEDILSHHRLYWTPPSAFNDPFDCHPAFVVSATPLQMRRRLHELIERFGPDMPANERRAIYRGIRHKPPEDIISEMSAATRRLRDAMGVLSLSARYDHPLMWAHYADSHRGIGLQFRTTNPFIHDFGLALPVQYSEERPAINIAAPVGGFDALTKALLAKADYWSYEREWRLIDQHRSGYHNFSITNLTGLILGAEIPAHLENKVRGWCAEMRSPPRIMRATIDDSRYRINVPDIQERTP
jgi:hypothetical protein